MEQDREQLIEFLKSHREAMTHWLSLMVRSGPVAMVAARRSATGQFEFLYVSSSFYELCGITPEELAADAQLVFSRVHPEDVPRLQEAIAESSKWLSAFHCEVRYLHPQRGEIWIEAHGTPLLNSEGSTLWYSINADVTQRKWAEHKLRDVGTTLRETLDNMLVGCQILDYDLRYKYLNENAVRHNRSSRDELLGQKLEDVFPGIETTLLYEAIVHCLRARVSKQLDSEFTFPDGSRGLFEVSIQPVPEGVLILSSEVTQQRILESQLRQAQKMEAIGRLAGGVAHDFNNLVTVIKNYSELLLMHIGDNMPMREWVLGIQDACQRSSRLTQQLLTFSRKSATEPKKLNVNTLLDNSVSLLRQLVGKDIVLSTELSALLPDIFADETQVEQVILNLVLNARDAMPKGGTLTISTKTVVLNEHSPRQQNLSPGTYVELTVSDTGEAIPDEIQSQIFEPFFTTKARGKGTGLGLAVAQRVVQQIGGDIDVISKAGVGTTFRLLFPAAA